MSHAPLRILHVTPYYEPAYVYGGPVRSVPALCKALACAECTVTVFTTTANGAGELDVAVSTPVIRDGVTVRYFSRSRPYSRFRARSMSPALRAEIQLCDLVHITGLWTHPAHVAASLAASAGVPYVISPRGMLMPWELGHKAWKKVPYLRVRELPRLRRSAAIHCTTPDELRALDRFQLTDQGFVVPNIVDPAEFSSLPPRGRLRSRLGVPADELVLLYLGRMHRKKGIELTLQTFSYLARSHAGLQLMLAGPDEGGYYDSIPRWTRDQGLTGRVHVIGELLGRERLQAYVDADLFVSLSGSENFGLTVAESMLCGLPVAVRRGVGLSDWVECVGAGVTVDPIPAAAAADIAGFLGRAERMKAVGEVGRNLVAREFSPAPVARQMVAAYTEILAAGKRA